MSRTDESGRDGLRAGLEALVRMAEWRTASSLSRDLNGRPFEIPVPLADLRALLDEHPATPAEEPAEVAVEERRSVDAILRLFPMSDDGTGHIADCGYTHDEGVCGCFDLPGRIATFLRDHDAALTAKAKAEGRVEALREAADAIESGDVDHEELRRSGVSDIAPGGWSDGSVIDAHNSGSVWADWLRLRANEETP